MRSFMELCISTHFFCKTTLKNKSIKKKKKKKPCKKEKQTRITKPLSKYPRADPFFIFLIFSETFGYSNKKICIFSWRNPSQAIISNIKTAQECSSKRGALLVLSLFLNIYVKESTGMDRNESKPSTMGSHSCWPDSASRSSSHITGERQRG